MKKILVAAFAVATLFSCGTPLPAGVHAQRDAQSLSMNVDDAAVRGSTTASGSVLDYELRGQWVGRYELNVERYELTLTTPRFTRAVPSDALSLSAKELAARLHLTADEAASLEPMAEVRARLAQHADELKAQLGVDARVASTRQGLNCSNNCCLSWQRASEAYSSGNTLGGAFWEGIAGWVC